MPAFLHFYSGLTPVDFRALDVADYEAMEAYRAAWLKAQEAPDGEESAGKDHLPVR